MLWSMRSELVLRSPSNRIGWEEVWQFSGRDEALLRTCLEALGRYLTPAPVERWDVKGAHIMDGEDPWVAAMLLFPEDVRGIDDRFAHPQFQAEKAWTSSGALCLARLLPDELGDLRDSIEIRFVGANQNS